MGDKLFEDGFCYICGMHTDTFCDRCNRLICVDHTITKHAPGLKHKHLCKECKDKPAHHIW